VITVEFKGIQQFQSDLASVPDKFNARVIELMSQDAYDSARRGSGAHFKTGALLQSLENVPVPGGRAVRHDPARAPYAAFVHDGTRPHVIRPKNKKALRWVSGNGFAFAKVVNHPGYVGDPWMKRAGDDAIARFQQSVWTAFDEAFR